jgi:hypothetical protein
MASKRPPPITRQAAMAIRKQKEMSKRKKLEKYLVNMSKRAAYTLAISTLVLSRLRCDKKKSSKRKSRARGG